MEINKRIYFYLILITSISALATDMIVPALPDIQKNLQIDSTYTQLLISAFLVVFAVSQFCVGFVGDRVEKTRCITLSLAVFVLGSVVCFFSKSITTLLAGRVVQAIGAGAGPILSRAIAKEVFHESKLKAVLSDISSASAVVPLVAPLMGGFILEYSRWQFLFLFMALFAFSVVFLTPPLSSRRVIEEEGKREGFVTPEFFMGTFLVSTVYSSLFCFISISPQIFIGDLALTPSQYSMIFSGCVFFFILGNQLSKLKKEWNLLWLFAVNLLVALPFLFHVASFSLLLASLVVLNLTLGVIYPTGHFIALQIKGHRTSLAASITGFVQTISAALISLFFVKLQSWSFSASQSLGLGVLTMALLSILVYLVYQSRQKKSVK